MMTFERLVPRKGRLEMSAAESGDMTTARPERFRSGLWTATGLVVLVAALMLASAPAAEAVSGACEISLQSASTLFEEGRFSAAREAINECLAGTPRRAEKKQAFALLTQIYLVLDNLPSADNAVTRLLDTDPEYEPDLFSSLRFRNLVKMAKARNTTPVVTSVSKSKESLLEAPATVVVITGEEIERRGYTDVQAVIYDLSGFDIARRAGTSYSNIYQRGYRSIETNRTLLLIDGVEENDVFAGTVFLSRQYPLSNIERIEVIHGPASTMYGANAFAGVINIITREAESYIPDGKGFGYDARVLGGSFGTYNIDATVAGQSDSGRFAWTLTARKHEADEFEHLRDYPEWDYDPDQWNGWPYPVLGNLNTTDPDQIASIIADHPNGLGSYFSITYDDQGNPTAINLTDAGAQRALQYDREQYAQTEFGSPVDDWLVYGKLRSSNLTFGFQLWRRMEGASAPLTDNIAGSGGNGFTFAPKHTFLYMKYSQRYLEDKLTLSLFSQYKRHELQGDLSRNVWNVNYALGGLGISNLIDDVPSFFTTEYIAQSDNQLRFETNVFYDHSEKFNIIAGAELRYSSVGSDLIISGEPNPSETGTAPTIPGGNQISSRDLGFFTQASYRPIKALKLVAGIRFDNNSIRDTGGYGTVFNPRLGVIYTWGDLVFKALYAEAFLDAPNFQKFGTIDGLRELDNPGLAPEEVNNIELSASWSPNEDVILQMVGYKSSYEGIVDQVEVQCPAELDCETTGQFQNAGSLDIQGVQIEARWTPGNYRFDGNYTYTDSFNPDEDLRVGEIATHQINLLGSALFFDHLEPSLRVNWVIDRETGPGTTVSLSDFSEIDDYVMFNGALTYRNILPGFDLQLAVENIADKLWYSPGIRNFPGFVVGGKVPQPGRAFFLRLRVTR